MSEPPHATAAAKVSTTIVMEKARLVIMIIDVNNVDTNSRALPGALV
jgi:hypothetical protein